MQKNKICEIIKALNEAGVRYLLAGGIAVIAHGHLRMTADLDIALAMSADNLQKAIQVFEHLGYKPRSHIRLADLADDRIRRQWIEEKHALVLNLTGKDPASPNIDLFLQFPYDFDTEWGRAESKSLAEGIEARIVSLETLIDMKFNAGRPKDLADLIQLKRIRAMRNENG